MIDAEQLQYALNEAAQQDLPDDMRSMVSFIANSFVKLASKGQPSTYSLVTLLAALTLVLNSDDGANNSVARRLVNIALSPSKKA